MDVETVNFGNFENRAFFDLFILLLFLKCQVINHANPRQRQHLTICLNTILADSASSFTFLLFSICILFYQGLSFCLFDGSFTLIPSCCSLWNGG